MLISVVATCFESFQEVWENKRELQVLEFEQREGALVQVHGVQWVHMVQTPLRDIITPSYNCHTPAKSIVDLISGIAWRGLGWAKILFIFVWKCQLYISIQSFLIGYRRGETDVAHVTFPQGSADQWFYRSGGFPFKSYVVSIFLWNWFFFYQDTQVRCGAGGKIDGDLGIWNGKELLRDD